MPGQLQLPAEVTGSLPVDVVKPETERRGRDTGFATIGSKQPIPKREDVSIIAVGFGLDDRRMQAMQAGRDPERTRVPLDPAGNAQVGMREHIAEHLNGLIGRQHDRRQPERTTTRITKAEFAIISSGWVRNAEETSRCTSQW